MFKTAQNFYCPKNENLLYIFTILKIYITFSKSAETFVGKIKPNVEPSPTLE